MLLVRLHRLTEVGEVCCRRHVKGHPMARCTAHLLVGDSWKRGGSCWRNARAEGKSTSFPRSCFVGVYRHN